MTAPPVSPTRRPRIPKTSSLRLPSGLQVLAAKRGGVPIVEMRLVTPLAAVTAAESNTRHLLAATLLGGTSRLSESAIADNVAGLGGTLSVSTGADSMTIRGVVPASGLEEFLNIVADAVTDAQFPATMVRSERDRVADELTIANSDPAQMAASVVAKVAFGRHPYGWGLPRPQAVARVASRRLQRMWARATPRGSVLVLVGGGATTRTADTAARVFEGWRGDEPDAVPSTGVRHSPAATIIDRPDAVQSNLRLIASAPARNAADYAACEVVNLAFGGYFASRYVANLREDKGYTYSPTSTLAHRRAVSTITVTADVATDVTGPALAETWHELARMAVGGVTEEEVSAAAAYRLGTTAIATQSQAGLANYLAALAPHGLSIDYLRNHAERVEAVDAAAAAAAARCWLAPRRFRLIVVGDASRIADDVQALWPVNVAQR